MTSNSDLPIKNHFFLCHYHEDSEEVEEFKKKLEESWITCWFDKDKIMEKLENETALDKIITPAINESYCMLVFATKKFLDSKISYKNIEQIIAREKKEILYIGDAKVKKGAIKKFGSIKFKDINQPSLIDDLKEIAWKNGCNQQNHAEHFLIMETDDKFTNNFRESLRKSFMKNKKAGLVYDHFAIKNNLSLGDRSEPDKVLDEMNIALGMFLDSEAKYAYIIMPKEPDWCKKFLENVKLTKKKRVAYKKLFCIECGKNFEDEYKNLPEHEYKSVKLIRIITDYNETTHKLFNVLKKKIQQSSHIVIVPGPKESEPADKRLKEFLGEIQEEYVNHQVREDDEKNSNDKKHKPLVSITILNIGTWKTKVAEHYAQTCLNRVESYDNEVHTAFICSNDATAIGVLFALSKQWDDQNKINPYLPKNISIYGFDRTEEFIDILKGNVDESYKVKNDKDYEDYIVLAKFLKAMKDSGQILAGATIRTDFDVVTNNICGYINADWKENKNYKHIKDISPLKDDFFSNIN